MVQTRNGRMVKVTSQNNIKHLQHLLILVKEENPWFPPSDVLQPLRLNSEFPDVLLVAKVTTATAVSSVSRAVSRLHEAQVSVDSAITGE